MIRCRESGQIALGSGKDAKDHDASPNDIFGFKPLFELLEFSLHRLLEGDVCLNTKISLSRVVGERFPQP